MQISKPAPKCCWHNPNGAVCVEKAIRHVCNLMPAQPSISASPVLVLDGQKQQDDEQLRECGRGMMAWRSIAPPICTANLSRQGLEPRSVEGQCWRLGAVCDITLRLWGGSRPEVLRHGRPKWGRYGPLSGSRGIRGIAECPSWLPVREGHKQTRSPGPVMRSATQGNGAIGNVSSIFPTVTDSQVSRCQTDIGRAAPVLVGFADHSESRREPMLPGSTPTSPCELGFNWNMQTVCFRQLPSIMRPGWTFRPEAWNCACTFLVSPLVSSRIRQANRGADQHPRGRRAEVVVKLGDVFSETGLEESEVLGIVGDVFAVPNRDWCRGVVRGGEM